MVHQQSFTDAEYHLKCQPTRKVKFLARMETLVPWQRLVEQMASHYPAGKSGPKGGGRKPWPLETLLRIHCLQQWYNLGDLTLEDALYDSDAFRHFTRLDALGRILDESTICKFRHLFERHELNWGERFSNQSMHI